MENKKQKSKTGYLALERMIKSGGAASELELLDGLMRKNQLTLEDALEELKVAVCKRLIIKVHDEDFWRIGTLVHSLIRAEG